MEDRYQFSIISSVVSDRVTCMVIHYSLWIIEFNGFKQLTTGL